MALLRNLRVRALAFLGVLGPGFITAMVDNDAGGIFTYSDAGARWGYVPLWTLLPITLLLVVSQEMCARMGAVTGKGLSDLIREEYGLRMTVIVMGLLLAVNFTNVAANFAGIAGAMELLPVSRYISVPLGALLVWVLVVKGTYQSVEKVFLTASGFYIAYVVSAVLVEPDWELAMRSTVRPALLADRGYIAVMIGMVGTSVAPWMQFYLQAAIVEKGIDSKQYRDTRVEVVVGCVLMAVVAFFIIVACAGAIWEHGARPIQSPAGAAEALLPLGRYAFALFAGGLLCSSLFASSILPLSTAYTVCEGLGLESGVDNDFDEAPTFYWMYTLLIVLGAGVVLIPDFPLVRMILASQVLNGILLPIVMIFIVRLANREDLMREWTNGRFYNFVAWSAVAVMIGLSILLAAFSIFPAAPVASMPSVP